VATQLVHHHQQVALGVAGDTLHTVEQHLVQALPLGTQGLDFRAIKLLGRQAITHPFATGLVVAPQHLETGTRQDVQNGLVRANFGLVIVCTAIRRKHAGQRHLGGGAAGLRMRVADHISPGQQRVGLAGIAVERKILGTCSFPNYQHKQHWPGSSLPG
jgi:hypothetical protein